MAIVIPSKNIYNTNNPKVRDNRIDNVSFEISKPSVTIDIAKPFSISYNSKSLKVAQDGFYESGVNQHTLLPTYGYNIRGAYISIKPFYTAISIDVDRKQKNSAITHIYSGKDEKGNNNITYSLIYNVYTGTASGSMVVSGSTLDGVTASDVATIYNVEPTQKTVSGNISLEDSYTYNYASSSTTTHINSVDETTISTVEPIPLGDISYRIPLYLLVGKETVKLGGYANGVAINTTFQSEEGFCEKTELLQLDLQYKGDTISLNFDEGTATIGSGNNPFSITRNELLQETNTINDEKFTDFIANRVISEYANGKETATVLVSVSEYYDDNGNLVISTKKNDLPMTFRIGDLVIPMVYGADGNDYPMSRNKDGSAKVFRVVGRKPYFDGAVWQELSLQEFDKANLS